MQPASGHFHLEPLTDGVYAAIARDGGAAGSNAGIVDLGDRCVLFDSLLTPQAARELVTVAEQATGSPVRVAINSHWHPDHTSGNVALPQGVPLISTQRTRDLIAENLPGWIDDHRRNARATLTRLREQIITERNPIRKLELANEIAAYEVLVDDAPDLGVRLPDITFADRLVLHGPARTVELLTFGGGHTESDAILYLPDDQIAFLGDLLFYELHPWLGSGDPDNWLRVYEQIEALTPPVEVIVPGHGAVCTPDGFAGLRRYWPTLQTLVREALVRDMTIDEVAALPIPAAFADWRGLPTFANNMRWTYQRMTQSQGVKQPPA